MRLLERLKAWRRGERVVKGATRGRAFEKKRTEATDGSAIPVRAKATAKLTKMKITRADGSTEEINHG